MIIRRPPRLTNRQNYGQFIEAFLYPWMKDLSVAFHKISFKDNFRSFLVENLQIPAGKEVAVENQFKHAYNGLIPIGRIITRQQGNATIIDGTTAWTESILYLQNPSANDAVVSVLFYT